MSHVCENCSKTFKSRAGMLSHQRSNKVCVINLSDKSENKYKVKKIKQIAVNTDDLIYNPDDKVDFPELESYDFNNIKREDNFSMCIIALRRSGKSTLLKHIFPHLESIHDSVYLISNSATASIYDFKKTNKFEEQKDDMIKDIFHYQRKSDMCHSLCIVMDDCVSYKKKHQEGPLQCYIRGRNRRISVIISSQYPQLIAKAARVNSDLIIIGFNSGEVKEFIVEKLLFRMIEPPPGIKTKSQKIDYATQLCDHYTKDYGFLIIDNVQKKLFKYKVPL